MCGGGIKRRGCVPPTRSPAALSERRQMAATFPLIRRAAQKGTALLTWHQPYPVTSGVTLGSFTLVSHCSRPLIYKPNLCKFNCEKLQLRAKRYIWQRHLKTFAELIHRHPDKELRVFQMTYWHPESYDHHFETKCEFSWHRGPTRFTQHSELGLDSVLNPDSAAVAALRAASFYFQSVTV